MNNISKIILLLLTIASLNANAWWEDHQPKMEFTPAKIKEITGDDLIPFLKLFTSEIEWKGEYSKGVQVDLNNDGVNDYVVIIPWLGCGLNGSGYDGYFIVSVGHGSRNVYYIEGYDMSPSDIVKINGKTYFRHSTMLGNFEKSIHNHWVYQIFSFEKEGYMRRANKDIGSIFPAVTIYYNDPRFEQIELTEADIKSIEKQTRPKSIKQR